MGVAIDKPQIFGKYLLLERIALGGMAEIFKAKTEGVGGFEKLLVIKRLHPAYSANADFIDMLIDEAKITVQLNHPNIGQVFDLGRVSDTYYIAMEYLDGCDLASLLQRCSEQGRMVPVEAACFIGQELLNGLDYAHRKTGPDGKPLGVIHRDVSPQNVLLSYEGEVKLIDFGIAKARTRAHATEAGIIKGKFCYMSPEQARGEVLDPRTDVFSAACVLYEMLTGSLVYHADSDSALMRRIRRAEFDPPRVHRPDLPIVLENILLSGLTRDRNQRHAGAAHFAKELQKFLFARGADFDRRSLADLMRQVMRPIGDSSGPRLSRVEYRPDPEASLIQVLPVIPRTAAHSKHRRPTTQVGNETICEGDDDSISGDVSGEVDDEATIDMRSFAAGFDGLRRVRPPMKQVEPKAERRPLPGVVPQGGMPPVDSDKVPVLELDFSGHSANFIDDGGTQTVAAGGIGSPGPPVGVGEYTETGVTPPMPAKPRGGGRAAGGPVSPNTGPTPIDMSPAGARASGAPVRRDDLASLGGSQTDLGDATVASPPGIMAQAWRSGITSDEVDTKLLVRDASGTPVELRSEDMRVTVAADGSPKVIYSGDAGEQNRPSRGGRNAVTEVVQTRNGYRTLWRVGLPLLLVVVAIELVLLVSRVYSAGGLSNFFFGAGQGTLEVRSDPALAAVEIDGTPRGITPYRAQVAAGRRRIRVSKVGFQSWEGVVEVSAGKEQSLPLVNLRVRSR
jgi:serine/threonine protein kinase